MRIVTKNNGYHIYSTLNKYLQLRTFSDSKSPSGSPDDKDDAKQKPPPSAMERGMKNK